MNMQNALTYIKKLKISCHHILTWSCLRVLSISSPIGWGDHYVINAHYVKKRKREDVSRIYQYNGRQMYAHYDIQENLKRLSQSLQRIKTYILSILLDFNFTDHARQIQLLFYILGSYWPRCVRPNQSLNSNLRSIWNISWNFVDPSSHLVSWS